MIIIIIQGYFTSFSMGCEDISLSFLPRNLVIHLITVTKLGSPNSVLVQF